MLRKGEPILRHFMRRFGGPLAEPPSRQAVARRATDTTVRLFHRIADTVIPAAAAIDERGAGVAAAASSDEPGG